MLLLITYDLHEPDRDYKPVITVIKSANSWTHPEESVWLVDTEQSPAWWRDKLRETSDDATYFVVLLTKNWASWKMSKSVVDWLKSTDRTW